MIIKDILLMEQFVTGRENKGGGFGYKQYIDSNGMMHKEVIGKTCETCGGSGRRNTGGSIQVGNDSPSYNSKSGLNSGRSCNKCNGLGMDTNQLFYGTLKDNYDPEVYAGTEDFKKDFKVMYGYIEEFRHEDKLAKDSFRMVGIMGAINYEMFSKISNGRLNSTKVSIVNGSTDLRYSPPRSKSGEIRPDDIITHTSAEKDKINKSREKKIKQNSRENIPYNVGKKSKEDLQQQDPELYKYLYTEYRGGNSMLDKIKNGLDARKTISKKGYQDIYRFINNEKNK